MKEYGELEARLLDGPHSHSGGYAEQETVASAGNRTRVVQYEAPPTELSRVLQPGLKPVPFCKKSQWNSFTSDFLGISLYNHDSTIAVSRTTGHTR
jgi:hypothetical protein